LAPAFFYRITFSPLFWQGALTKDPEDAEVRALSRSSSPGELLHGPAQCAAALAWTGWRLLGSPESAVLAASLAVADGLAPMAGRWYGRHAAGGRSSSYPSYRRRHLPSHQRAEGTVAGALVGTALCTYLYQWLMGFPPLPLRLVLAYGGIAAVVGALLKGADNLAVPVALHLLMPRVQGWLAA
jgi:dolichol kinase